MTKEKSPEYLSRIILTVDKNRRMHVVFKGQFLSRRLFSLLKQTLNSCYRRDARKQASERLAQLRDEQEAKEKEAKEKHEQEQEQEKKS